uniref:MerR family transcriptional regulator n=1 Tax=Alistipes sp. TaxID=1872444 RepID=UPI00405764D5
MVEKVYYSMGDVTEMFDVEPTVIRYWCAQFSCLRPKRNSKGNRIFSRQDVERLKRIHHLLRERKMTVEGAKKAMRRRSIEAEEVCDNDMVLLEQLQTLRAMLLEMRDSIGEDIPVEESQPTVVATATEQKGEQVEAQETEGTTQKKKRAPRRKLIGEEGVVERPLFPFFEQTLF